MKRMVITCQKNGCTNCRRCHSAGHTYTCQRPVTAAVHVLQTLLLLLLLLLLLSNAG